MAVLTGEALAKAQAGLRDSIRIADEAIYSPDTNINSFWDRYNNLIENVLTLGTLTEMKTNVNRSYAKALADWELRKTNVYWPAANHGTFEGEPLTDKQARTMFETIQADIKSVAVAVDTIGAYARGRVLDRAVTDVLGQIAKIFAKAGEAVGAVADGALTVAAVIGKALPLIIGILVLAPFVLRTFSAYRRGGASAAADEAAGQIERGRAAAGRAVSKGARMALTRGMAGAPKRRRRNR